MPQKQHNLPLRRKRFIGRTGEMAKLDKLLREAPLVTILGAGGLGKTRLAINYATKSDHWEHVLLIDLAKARTLDQFLSAVTDTLPTPPASDAPGGRIGRLGHAMAQLDPSLLIFDNLEQVVDPAAHAIRRWMELAPNVSFLATSREALHLRGERLLRLAPLPEDEAVELFAHRASQVRPEFELDDTNRSVVAQIVRYLDALPLAVELAAARVNVIAPADILERLTAKGGGLHTLIRKTRHATVRHQSMRATLYWSWELLEPEEQQVLAGASIFRGGFDLPAAEAVLKTDEVMWVGDVLEALVDKSLVITSRSAEPNARAARRFRLFETTREFARTMLEDEQRDELERRHAQYFADRLAEAKRLRRAQDADNVEAAFWAMADKADPLAARLALGAYRMRRARDGYTIRQLEIVDAALADEISDAKLRAKLFGARARCYFVEGRYADALADVKAGLAAADEVGARARRAHLLHRKAMLLRACSDPSAALVPLGEALELADQLRDMHAIVKMRHLRAMLDWELGEFRRACTELTGALELARRHDLDRLEARILVDLAHCHIPLGELESAEVRLQDAGTSELAHTARFQLRLLEAKGVLEWYRGRNTRAFEVFTRGLELAAKQAWHQTGAGRRLNPMRYGLSALDAAEDDTTPDEHLRAVLQSVWTTEDVQDRVQAGTRLGILHLRRGEYLEAAHLLRQATEEVDGLPPGPLRAHVRCWAAIAETAADRRERAETLLDEAREIYERAETRALADDVAYFLRAGECLAEPGLCSAEETADIAEDLHTRAKERRFQPHARIWQWVCYDHLLELADLFEKAATAPKAQGGLAVARDGSAFRLPDGEVVDLSSREALSLIMAELARRRSTGNNNGVSVDALSEVGWPDAKLTKSAGSSRVYTAIRTLRTMGLDDILLTGHNGYILDPELAFEWLD